MQRSKGPTLQNENTHTKTENMLGNRLWNEENETFVVALLDCQTTIFEAACNTNTFVEAIGWQQFAQANWNEKCMFRVFLTVFFSITQPAKSFLTWKNSSKNMSVWLQLIFHFNPEKGRISLKKKSRINIERKSIQ